MSFRSGVENEAQIVKDMQEQIEVLRGSFARMQLGQKRS